MPVINKVSQDLVFDLINASNPNSPVKFSSNNVLLGKLTAITPSGASIQNTKVMVSNKPSSEYIGRVEVTYRRLDLAKLFRGLTITIAKFSPKVKAGSGNAWDSFVKDLLPTFNSQMGTAFTADDFVDLAIGRGSLNAQNRYQSSVTVQAKNTSWAYVGSFTFVWVDAPQDIDSVVTVTDLDGRLYPAGNVFDELHPVVVSQMAYGIDWTDVLSTQDNINAGVDLSYLMANGGGGVLTGSSNLYARNSMTAAFKVLNDLYPAYKFDIAAMYNNWQYAFVTLPSSAWPEANTEFFNRLLVLTPVSADKSKTTEAPNGFVGSLFFHFNI